MRSFLDLMRRVGQSPLAVMVALLLVSQAPLNLLASDHIDPFVAAGVPVDDFPNPHDHDDGPTQGPFECHLVIGYCGTGALGIVGAAEMARRVSFGDKFDITLDRMPPGIISDLDLRPPIVSS